MNRVILIFCLIFFAGLNVPVHGDSELLSDSINKVSAIKAGEKVVIPGFYFNAGSSIVNANLKDHVRRIAAEMKRIKYKKIIVEAYTDNSGSAEMNRKLSGARAKAVSGELKKNGISAKKIEYFARGSQKPLADNNTKNGRVQNRRIEITVQ